MPSSTPPPGQAFADAHPELVDEWDYDANSAKGRTPYNTTARSSFRAYWICRVCDHRWMATPNNRSRGHGCRQCGIRRSGKTRQKPPAGKSLADLNPVVAAQWHPQLNGEVTPFDVFSRSEVPRWWLCPHGHEELCPPKRRVLKATTGGCTICGGRRVQAGYNDLATTHPHVAADWATQLNTEDGLAVDEVSAGSERQAWWICPAGHTTKAMIKTRVRSTGCPECQLISVSRVEMDIRCELIAMNIPVDTSKRRWKIGEKTFQLDIVVPDWLLIIEFDGYRWHKPAELQRRDLEKTRYLQDHGWTVVRMRDRLEPLTEHDIRVDMADSTLPMVKALLVKLLKEGYVLPSFEPYLHSERLWGAAEANRQTHRERTFSLATEHPELCEEFDPALNEGLRPEALHPGSNRHVSWRCSTCSHQWEAAVNMRTGTHNRKGSGCPRCAVNARVKLRRTPKPGQSLAEVFPDLLPEWDYEKNKAGPETFRPYSESRVWWICPERGHSYDNVITTRTRGRAKCPICAGKRVMKGVNDLATTHPELLQRWDYEKNTRLLELQPDAVMAGSDKFAYWVCPDCGSEKKAKIYTLKQGKCCMHCGAKRRGEKRKIAPPGQSLADICPELIQEWDQEANDKLGLNMWTVFPQSHQKAFWCCPVCSHQWLAKIQGRFLGNGCPHCHRSVKKKQ